MEKGKFANIRFVIVESHVHIIENPKASTRCDEQSPSYYLYLNAAWLSLTCRLCLYKSCDIENGIHCVRRYCCGEVC